MKGRIAFAFVGAVLAGFSLAPTAKGSCSPTRERCSAETIKIGVYSQKESASHASAGASISVKGSKPARGSPVQSGTHTSSTQLISAPRASGNDVAVYPTLPSTSPFLRNPQPFGPNTFWYSDGSGHMCIYMANSVLPCYTVTTPGGGSAAGPALNPAAIAAAIAARLELAPGRVVASPVAARGGLTGADSWFWLSPAPRREVLSISLRGERVSVSADPSVEWRFGDGAALFGGPGRPYVPGPPPADSIRHLYETRCLPSDVGRNPYVLPSCGVRGYPIEALVHWAISFEASGPIAASGSLPSRTTSAGVAYPVSEARAFLVRGGSG
jgi:hypothetical protein